MAVNILEQRMSGRLGELIESMLGNVPTGSDIQRILDTVDNLGTADALLQWCALYNWHFGLLGESDKKALAKIGLDPDIAPHNRMLEAYDIIVLGESIIPAGPMSAKS